MIELSKLKKLYGGNFNSMSLYSTHCVYITNSNGLIECIGDLLSFKKYTNLTFSNIDVDCENAAQFEHSARIETSKMLQNTGKPIAFIDFIDGGKRTAKSPEYGKIIIEL